MNRADHHAKAEQLLEQARTTPDQISRSEILAEAQVHATLALSAPAGEGPPGPGLDEAADTQSTRTKYQAPPEAGDMVAAGEPNPPSAQGGFPDGARSEPRSGRPFGRQASQGLPVTRPVPQPPPAGPVPPPPSPGPAPDYRRQPARPAGGRPAPDDPGEQEPDEQEPDDPGEEEPSAPGKPEPRGPEEPEPGGFDPFG
jgi:hypothetical protein